MTLTDSKCRACVYQIFAFKFLIMPGCTVRGCSNSSAKGFKVHHFPSDFKRRSIWIKNCEREQTWEPSRYTCICDVHFEDSQFESRRADGLRRLKPNAIPTLFNKQGSSSARRLLTNPPIGTPIVKQETTSSYETRTPDLPVDVDLSFKQVSHQSVESFVREGVSEQLEKKYSSTNTIKLEGESSSAFATHFTDHDYPLKDTYFQIQPNIPNECAEETQKNSVMPSNIEINQSLSKTLLDHPKFQEKGNLNQVVGSATKPLQKGNNKEGNITKAFSDDGHLACYICSENAEVTADIVIEKVSKASTYLGKILSEECLLDPPENKDLGLLCSRCIGLLGYTNRLETEVDVIKKAILSNLRHTNGMSLNSRDSPLNDMGRQSIEGECHLSGKHWTDDFLNKSSRSVPTDFTSLDNSVVIKMHRPEEKQHECRLCNFQTPHKSLLIYHLRQHLTSSLRCDYCAACLTGHNNKRCVQLHARHGDEGEFQGGVSCTKLHDVQDNSIVEHDEKNMLMCENDVFFKCIPSESVQIMQSSTQPCTELTHNSSLDAYPPINQITYEQCDDSHGNLQNNLKFVLPGEEPIALFENNFVTSSYNITIE